MKNDTEVTAIKEIVLKLGKKELKLTPEECKKLREILEELFGSKVVIKEVHEKHFHHDHWYERYYYYPNWPYSTSPIWYSASGISATSNGDILSIVWQPPQNNTGGTI